MSTHVCKICQGDEEVVGLTVGGGRAFVGFFCRRHADMLKSTAQLGTTLVGLGVKAWLAWKHPKILAAIEQTVAAVQAPPGEYERMDVQ